MKRNNYYKLYSTTVNFYVKVVLVLGEAKIGRYTVDENDFNFIFLFFIFLCTDFYEWDLTFSRMLIFAKSTKFRKIRKNKYP